MDLFSEGMETFLVDVRELEDFELVTLDVLERIGEFINRFLKSYILLKNIEIFWLRKY